MPPQILQRVNWHGTAIGLGELFILHKNRREAKAVLFTHQLGWEVRLIIGAQAEVAQTQVCRTQEEVFSTGEAWRQGMIEKGWHEMRVGNTTCPTCGGPLTAHGLCRADVMSLEPSASVADPDASLTPKQQYERAVERRDLLIQDRRRPDRGGGRRSTDRPLA